MLLKSLQVENFLSFSKLDIDFKNGLFLVDGYNYDNNTANGAGKSAIFDAIVYALYGKTPRNCKLNDFIKIGTDQQLRVIFNFIKNGVEYSIERNRNPDELIFRIDGQKFTDYVDSNELNYKISSVFGLSYNTFISSVYFSQNRSENFLISSDDRKKKILTELLGLEIFDKVLEKVKEDYKKCEKQLDLLKFKYKSIQESISKVKEDVIAYENIIKEKQKEKESEKLYINNKIKSLQSQLLESESKIVSLKEQSVKVQEYEDNIELLEDKRKKINGINLKIEKFSSEIDFTKKELSKKKKEKDNLQDFLRRKVCYTCGQKIYEVDRINENIKNIDIEIKQLEDKIEEVYKKRRECKAIYEKHNPQIEQNYKKYFDLRQQAINAKSLLDNFSKRKIEIEKDISQLEEKKQQLEKKYQNVDNYAQKQEETLKEYELNLEKNKEDLIKTEKNLNVLFNLKEIFGKEGVKASVFIQVVSELNILIQKYLIQLFEQQVSLKFLLQTELKSKKNIVDKFDLELKVNNQDMEFGLLSGGEKKRLILAVDFALAEIVSNRCGNNFEFMILDEVFDSLDVISKSKVMDFLENLTDKKKQIYVIDHSTQFKNRFDDDIFIEKKGGESCLKEYQ